MERNAYGGWDYWDGNSGRGVRYNGAGEMIGFLDP